MLAAAMFHILLLTGAATPPTTPLVLRDGTRFDVQGPIQVDRGRLLFHQPDGKLYSLPVEELDEARTRAAAIEEAVIVTESAPEHSKLGDYTKLKGSAEEKDKLLREIEKNHSGTLVERLPPPVSAVTKTDSAKSDAGTEAKSQVDVTVKDETAWRERARVRREAVRQAEEELDLLRKRQRRLEDQILGFSSLGYRSSQFTYQTSQLEQVREDIERAKLELVRAQRAWDDFKDEARRQDVLPGWLR